MVEVIIDFLTPSREVPVRSSSGMHRSISECRRTARAIRRHYAGAAEHVAHPRPLPTDPTVRGTVTSRSQGSRPAGGAPALKRTTIGRTHA